MAKKKQETQNTQAQENKNEQTPQETKEIKKEPVIYTGEPIVNEKFFLRPGQIFMEIPAYIKDKEIREKFVPVSKVKNK